MLPGCKQANGGSGRSRSSEPAVAMRSSSIAAGAAESGSGPDTPDRGFLRQQAKAARDSGVQPKSEPRVATKPDSRQRICNDSRRKEVANSAGEPPMAAGPRKLWPLSRVCIARARASVPCCPLLSENSLLQPPPTHGHEIARWVSFGLLEVARGRGSVRRAEGATRQRRWWGRSQRICRGFSSAAVQAHSSRSDGESAIEDEDG